MKMLLLALYAEDSTDARFLPPIIRRTAERIITQHGQDLVDVSESMIVPKQQDRRREDAILSVAYHVYGYHALIVHSDADDRTPDRADTDSPLGCLTLHLVPEHAISPQQTYT